METGTRYVFKLVVELDDFFRSARITDMDITWYAEESKVSRSQISRLPDLQDMEGEHGYTWTDVVRSNC